ncbi:MAG: hypothetical protein ACFBSD_16585 [Paracoccaceae bacterium]
MRELARADRAAWPEAVDLHGPYLGFSGMDNTTRSLAKALAGLGVALGLVDLPHWSAARLPAGARDPWFDAIAGPVGAALAVHLCMPHQLRPRRGQRTVNFTMFEATPAPSSWIAAGRRADVTVLPTEAAREAWIAAGADPERLRLCPLGVDAARFRPGHAALPLGPVRGRPVADFAVRFLNVSDIVPRKNLLGLLRVWLSATAAEDDAVLLLKLSHGRGSSVQFLRDLQRLEAALGRPRDRAAPILIFDDVLSDADLPRLYATATHYWSLSHGEGWDQPMTEAGATGLRLIAPDHTAYRSYLTPEHATLIPAREEPVPSVENADIRAFFEGARWWRPDEDAAAEAIRTAIERRDPAVTARARLAERFGWDRSAARLLDILAELPPPGRGLTAWMRLPWQ